jgi:hypothetical protein
MRFLAVSALEIDRASALELVASASERAANVGPRAHHGASPDVQPCMLDGRCGRAPFLRRAC